MAANAMALFLDFLVPRLFQIALGSPPVRFPRRTDLAYRPDPENAPRPAPSPLRPAAIAINPTAPAHAALIPLWYPAGTLLIA